MKASWNARQRGASISSRFLSARATARFATRKASSASASSARTRDAALDPVGSDAREAQQLLRRLAPRALRAPRASARRASIQVAVLRRRAAAAPPRPRHHRRAAPSASIESSTPGTSTVAVFSTSALGIQAVRSRWHAPSTISHSAETPWPVAYSGVSA